MYDELTKRLRELASIPEHCEDVESCDQCLKEDICLSFTNKRIIEVVTQAANAIEELQKQLREEKVDNINLTGWLAEEHAKHLWIPVTERLPEKYDRVLVYSKATRMGRSIDFINADGNWYTTPKVTHWMPLPKAPESEGE